MEKEFLGGGGMPDVPPITGDDHCPNTEVWPKEWGEKEMTATRLKIAVLLVSRQEF
jgi:hypothetical protein